MLVVEAGRLDLPDPIRDEDVYPCTCAECMSIGIKKVRKLQTFEEKNTD